MAFKEVLRLVVEADTGAAVRGLDNVGKAADKSLTKGKSGLDKFGLGLQKAGVGMVGFGAIALAGLGGLAKQSEEAHLSTVKLQNSLANNPRLAGQNVKAYTDLATAIQGKTAADGDDITAGIAVLAQGKLQANQIKTLTPLVVDLARKKGMDEVAAFTLASKAVAGNAGALKRAGIQVDETKFKTDAYGATVDALKGSVGGFAEDEGKTFAGSLQRMKNQLGDLAEGVGGGAVDAFTDLFAVVGKAAGALEKVSPGAQNTIGKIATFGAVALVAVGGVSSLIGKLIEIRRTFGQAADGVRSFTSKMGGVQSAAGLAAGALGVGALVLEARHLTQEANRLDVGKITGALNSVSEGGHDAATEMVKVSLAFNHGERDIKQIADASVPAAREFLRMAEALGAPEPLLKKLRKAIADKKAEDVGAGKAQSDYTDEVDKSTEALDAEVSSTEAATQALKDYEDKLHALVDPLFGLQDALEGNRDAQGEVHAKTLEAIAAQDAYTAAVKKFGPKSKEASAAFLEMTGAQNALTDANTHAVRSAEDVDFAVEELRTEIEKNPAALDQAKQKLKQWQAQGLITAGQAAATARKFDALAASVKKVPSSKVISVTAHGTEGAKIKIIQVKDALGQLHDKTLTIGVTTALGAQAAGIMNSKMFAGQFASGGKVPGPKGSSQIIEAHGGEIVVPAHDAAAMRKFRPQNFGMTAPAMAGGGGTTVINNTFVMAGAIISSEQEATRWVSKAVNRGIENRMVNVRGRPL